MTDRNVHRTLGSAPGKGWEFFVFRGISWHCVAFWLGFTPSPALPLVGGGGFLLGFLRLFGGYSLDSLVFWVAWPGVPALPRPCKGDVKRLPVGYGRLPPLPPRRGAATRRPGARADYCRVIPEGRGRPPARGRTDIASRVLPREKGRRPPVGAVAAAESLDLASDKSHGYPGGTLDANGGIGVTWAVPPMVGVKGSWDVADAVIIERMYGDCQRGFGQLGGVQWAQDWFGAEVSGFRPTPE